jgi:hypothetical protein
MTPAVDYGAFLRVLVAQISNATGVPTTSIFAAQPTVAFTDQPPQPMFTVHVASSTRYGYDYGDDQDALIGPRGLAVSFNCFAEEHEQAMGLMETWGAALFSEEILVPMRAAGFPPWSAGQVLDLSETYDTGFQPRAYLQVMFGATSIVTNPTGEITTVLDDQVVGEIH